MNRVAYFLKAKHFSSQVSENQVLTPPPAYFPLSEGDCKFCK
jgi:hypothetical protein